MADDRRFQLPLSPASDPTLSSALEDWTVLPDDVREATTEMPLSSLNALSDSPEVALLLAAASPCFPPSLVKEQLQKHPHLRWDVFERIASAQGLLQLAERRLRAGLFLPPLKEILDRSRQAYFVALRRNLFLDNLTVHITVALASAGLPTLLFKGTPIVRQLYGDLGVRSIDAVDLLVHREQVGRAKEILHSMGFHERSPQRFSPPHYSHILVRSIGGTQWRVNLHWDFPALGSARRPVSEVWRTAMEYSALSANELNWKEWDHRLSRPQIFALSPELQFLVCLYELTGDGFQPWVGFADLCQTTTVYGGLMDWNRISEIIWSSEMRTGALQGLTYAKAWGLGVPEVFRRRLGKTFSWDRPLRSEPPSSKAPSRGAPHTQTLLPKNHHSDHFLSLGTWWKDIQMASRTLWAHLL